MSTELTPVSRFEEISSIEGFGDSYLLKAWLGIPRHAGSWANHSPELTPDPRTHMRAYKNEKAKWRKIQTKNVWILLTGWIVLVASFTSGALWGVYHGSEGGARLVIAGFISFLVILAILKIMELKGSVHKKKMTAYEGFIKNFLEWLDDIASMLDTDIKTVICFNSSTISRYNNPYQFADVAIARRVIEAFRLEQEVRKMLPSADMGEIEHTARLANLAKGLARKAFDELKKNGLTTSDYGTYWQAAKDKFEAAKAKKAT